MMYPNEEQRVALESIASNVKVMEFLCESKNNCNETLETCKDEISFRWQQGRVQALGDLISLIKGVVKPNFLSYGIAKVPRTRPTWP